MQPIKLSSYKKQDLLNRIEDNKKRGYELIEQWEQAYIDRDGIIKSVRYCAKMNKVNDNKVGVLV